MRKETSKHHEDGFVLITTLLLMLVLTIIGIAANRNTSIELQIAGNDKVHKKTFYAAEAGAILGAELVEQNLNCATGFGVDLLEETIQVHNLIFSRQQPPDLRQPVEDVCDIVGIVDNDGKPLYDDVSFYNDDIVNDRPGTTHLYIWGKTEMAPGGSLIMAAGYEGKGKSAAGGGVYILFDIFSQHLGLTESESIIQFGWRHMVGNETKCNYK